MAFLGLLLSLPPGDAGKDEWTFWHAGDHNDIRSGIEQFGKGNLPSYPLDPFVAWDATGWGFRHQNAHNDMNGALGLSGSDLSNVDFQSPTELDEWLFLNFMEHAAAHQAIGI